MNLIYISGGGILDSAFNSQVKNLINILSNRIRNIILIIPIDIRKFINSDQINIENINANIKVIYTMYIPFVNRTSSIINSFLLCKTLKNIFMNFDRNKTIIHVRGNLWSYTTIIALNLLKINIPLLSDFRGVYWKEIELYSNILNRYRSSELKKIEKFIYRNSSAISIVSDSYKKYLIGEYGNRDKVYINPSVVNKQFFSYELLKKNRDLIRKQIGISNNDFILIFSTGGGAKWQNIHRIIRDVRYLNNRMDYTTFKFLLITRNKNIIKEYKNNNDIFVFSVNFEDVGKYLIASDIAIMERERNLVNTIACPIKFGEYLVSGLPVIINNVVDSAVKIVNNYKVGIIKNNISELNENDIVTLMKLNRKNISEIGLKIFNLETISKNYLNIYNKLIA